MHGRRKQGIENFLTQINEGKVKDGNFRHDDPNIDGFFINGKPIQFDQLINELPDSPITNCLMNGIQQGVLDAGEITTRNLLKQKNITIQTSHKRYDLVIKNNGDINFTARFYIDSLITENGTKLTGNSFIYLQCPLAIVVTECGVRDVFTDKIPFFGLATDKIILLDDTAKEFFDTNENIQEKTHSRLEEINDEITNEILLNRLDEQLTILNLKFTQDTANKAQELATNLTASKNHADLPRLHEAISKFRLSIALASGTIFSNDENENNLQFAKNLYDSKKFIALNQFLFDTYELKNEQEFTQACSTLEATLKRFAQDEDKKDLLSAGNKILNLARLNKENNLLNKEELPKLTTWVKGVSDLIYDPLCDFAYSKHQTNTKDVMALCNKYRGLKIFAACMLVILGIALAAVSIAIAIASFGGSAPLSAAGLGVAGALTVAGLSLLGAKIATGFIVGVGITLGVGSVVTGGLFANRGYLGEMGMLGKDVTAAATDYRKNKK